MPDLSWLAVLAPALLGGVAGALLTTRLNASYEHRRWLREERLQTYLNTLELASAITRRFREDDDGGLLDAATSAGARLRVLAPQETAKAGEALIRAALRSVRSPKDDKAKSEVKSSRDAFRRAAQKDLRSQR